MVTTMMHALTTKAVDIVLAALLLLGSVTGAQIGRQVRAEGEARISAAGARGDRAARWRCAWRFGLGVPARRDLHGGAAVSARVRPARCSRCWPCVHAERRSATRSWCPRSRQHEVAGAAGLHRHGTAAVRRDPRSERQPRRARLRYRRGAQRARPSRSSCAKSSKVAGIWVNADSSDFRSAPSFFAVAIVAPDRRDRR